MKRMMALVAALSILGLADVSSAQDAPIDILFSGQDMPVGICEVFAAPDADQMQVCVDCSLNQFDSTFDGAWCGEEVKWDTGVETAAGSVITITQTRKNNPIPGRFPYSGPFINGNGVANSNGCYTSFSACAPANDACSGEEGPIAVAIHADISNGDTDETAWAAECLQPDGIFGCQEWGTEFAGKNWATYVHVPCDTGLPGTCSPGVLSCSSDSVGPYPYCASINAEPEVCDGIDNDCDGVIDNGNPGGGESCETGLPGECSTGTTQCRDGSVVCELEGECASCYSQCFDIVELDILICSQLYPTVNPCYGDCMSDQFSCIFSAFWGGDFGGLAQCFPDYFECLDICASGPNPPPSSDRLECVNAAMNSLDTCTSDCF